MVYWGNSFAVHLKKSYIISKILTLIYIIEGQYNIRSGQFSAWDLPFHLQGQPNELTLHHDLLGKIICIVFLK